MDGSVPSARSGRWWPVPARTREGWGRLWSLTATREQARDRRLLWLLIGVWIVNLFDLCFTLLAVEQRILVELNPVAARLLAYGPGVLTLYKFSLLSVGTAILWRCRRHRLSETAAWVVAILCVALALIWYKLYLDAQPQWVEADTINEILPHHTTAVDQPVPHAP